MALVGALLLLSVVGAGAWVVSVSGEAQRRVSAQSVAVRLADARESLLAWSLAHPMYPGLLPFPDRAADGNYDGTSDCSGGGVSGQHLVGRLPWRATYLGVWCALGGLNPANNLVHRAGIGLQERYEHVPMGTRDDHLPWVAVSRNLVYDPSQPVTPVNLRFPQIDGTLLTTAPYPWMRVLDDQGQVLSDRVALVILDAGNPIAAQLRAAPPTAPGAHQFLDRWVKNGSVVDHADASSLDFVAADGASAFNDRLSFVTIDEWLAAMTPYRQRRLLAEVVAALDRYYQHWGEYPPFAADPGETHLGSPCLPGRMTGRLPLGHRAGCVGLHDSLPASTFGEWVRRHAAAMGYQRHSLATATLTLDGVSHAISR